MLRLHIGLPCSTARVQIPPQALTNESPVMSDEHFERHRDALYRIVLQAVADEREACARVAAEFFNQPNLPRHVLLTHNAGAAIADAIRARSSKST